MKNNQLSLIAVFCFFLSITLHAQVTFETQLSKNRLGINERLRVSFKMNQNGDNFIPPNFQGFTIVGGPNQSVSNSWVNGVRSFSKSYTYFLTPTKKGNLVIGQASIEIDGEIYKTSPKKVEVTTAVNNPNSPQSQANAIADENLHLVAELSKSDPYINEAITVIYKLYFSSEISVSNVNEVEMPKYSDFWSHMIPIPKLEIKRGEYKGQSYNYVTWRKTVLYPQKEGKLVLDPLTLNVSVDVPTNRRDFFGNRVYQKAPKMITAGKRTLNVRPLPEKAKPSDYSGAVGDFDLNVSFNKSELKSSESFQATVKVSGRGNLNLFSLPKFNAPSTLEVYEPEHKESIKTNLLGMQGSIQDIYTIVPQYQGNYPIPPVVFSYFDPVKEEYITLSSKEKLIDVYEGPSASNQNQNNTKVPQILTKTSPYFDFIKLASEFNSINSPSFYQSNRFWAGLFSPILLFALFIFILRKSERRQIDPLSIKQKRNNRLAKKYLSTAKKALGKKEEFYVALERALHNYLKSKLAIETVDFSKEKISTLLQEKRCNVSIIKQFTSILEQCEVARYSPSTSVRMEDDLSLALTVISELDRDL